jgi:cytochrome c oxidase subunit II
VNGTQLIITIVYGLLLVPCVVGLVLLVRSTHQPTGGVDHDRLARGEVQWGWVAATLLAVTVGITIWQVPYFASAKSGSQQVVVGAQQYAWTLKPNTVRAGRSVEFHLKSRDVQHGFGIYDGTKLLFQVQVPAKTEPEQRYTYTFDKPGRYEILCLEYCGFQHHLMRGALTVR